MIGNLKGNLEMCLSARLGTSANIGELDERRTRRTLMGANMTLLGLQALLISFLAAIISFVLGLLTIHRLGDIPDPTVPGNATVSPIDAGLAVGEVDWHEGYTRPGFKQLMMVLATGMGAAGISSAALGSFMSSLIVLSRWWGLDPDNITPPLAACLGDLVTLYILAILGTSLVDWMDSPLPLIAVVLMALSAIWFTRRVMRNEWVKNVAKGGWAPLVSLLSSHSTLTRANADWRDAHLERNRNGPRPQRRKIPRFRSVGNQHDGPHRRNRCNPRQQTLNSAAHSLAPPAPWRDQANNAVAYPKHRGAILPRVPMSGVFYGLRLVLRLDRPLPRLGRMDLFCAHDGRFAGFGTWIDRVLLVKRSGPRVSRPFSLSEVGGACVTDISSYTLPIQSALVDLIGHLLLVLAYEICIRLGRDVVVHDPNAGPAPSPSASLDASAGTSVAGFTGVAAPTLFF